MNPTKEQAEEFTAYLRTSTESLQDAIKGRFEYTQHPLDFAYGVIIGARITRCECGKWGDVEDLAPDGPPLPCPHNPEKGEHITK